VLGAPIGLCSEEHELICREGPFRGSIIHTYTSLIGLRGTTVVFSRFKTNCADTIKTVVITVLSAEPVKINLPLAGITGVAFVYKFKGKVSRNLLKCNLYRWSFEDSSLMHSILFFKAMFISFRISNVSLLSIIIPKTFTESGYSINGSSLVRMHRTTQLLYFLASNIDRCRVKKCSDLPFAKQWFLKFLSPKCKNAIIFSPGAQQNSYPIGADYTALCLSCFIL
jgi:hypothetical protein